MLLSCVDDSALNNIPTVVIHIASFIEIPLLTQIGLDRIKRLIYLAENKNVNLAFENLNYMQPLDYVSENIKSNQLGFCYDSGHENCCHPTADCLTRYGDKLFAVHVADNFGNADTHLLPYDGTVIWSSITKKLRKCRPLEYLTFEVGFKPDHAESHIYNICLHQNI